MSHHRNRCHDVRETNFTNQACLANRGGVSLTLCTPNIIYVTHWWCYFSHHFALGLKGSAAIVTQARAPWHILKWPPAFGLGVLTFGFASFSCCHSLHLSVSFLPSVLLPLVTVPTLYPPAPTDTNGHARMHAHTCIPFHPLISAPLSFSLRGHPCFLWALKIIASDLDSDSISGILQ